MANAILKRLLQAGYPESTAKKIASGELPMDFTSRMNRARELGYTTEAFRVGGVGEDQLGRIEFDPTAGFAQRSGGGTWFSQDAPLTLSYAKPEGASYRTLLDTRNFGQVDAGGANWNDIYNTDFIFPSGESIPLDEINRLLASNAPTKAKRIAVESRGAINTTDKIGRAAKELGLSGVEVAQVRDIGPSGPFMMKNLRGTESGRNFLDDYGLSGGTNYSVQDPSKIRSYYGAAFDPDQVGNPNILASAAPIAAGGILGALGLPENATAADLVMAGKEVPKEQARAETQQMILDALLGFMAPTPLGDATMDAYNRNRIR